MKTKNQAKDWINSKVGIGIDFDGWYGYQCMDLAVAYMYYITDGKLTLWGNAKDAINNNLKGYATLHKNTPQFLPKMGDIAVWTTGNFSEFGHIAIVTSANLDTFNAIEQNWNGGGLTLTEVTTKRKKSYQNVTHFIRPNFKSTSKKKPVSKQKTPTKSKAKKSSWSFKVGGEPIITRIGKPSLKAISGGSVKPNQTMTFNKLVKSNGFEWGMLTNYRGQKEYVPIRPLSQKGYWGVLK